jgi:hypothetical protein
MPPANGRIESYCTQDVLLTLEFGVRHGYLIYQHRQGALVRIPVDWRQAFLIFPNKPLPVFFPILTLPKSRVWFFALVGVDLSFIKSGRFFMIEIS